jgi:glycosyltransferase involved in cell wall biosynthesis
MNESVSLIMTLRNEAGSLPALFASIAAQSRTPDEIVAVDDGSSDDTAAVLAQLATRFPLRVLDGGRRGISHGRNVAIAAARGPLIASTDGGTTLDRNWLAALTAPFADPDVDVVAGFFATDPQTTFEMALGATIMPDLRDAKPDKFLPAGRSMAFRKAAWQRAGGFPEWLDYCEDLVFDLTMKRQGARFVFAPHAIAHARPRTSLRAFWRQYYNYARGDGKADLWRRRHLIRYLTYAALPALLLAPLRRRQLAAPCGLLLGLGFGVYTATPYRRLAKYLPRLSSLDRLRAIALVPLIRVVGDLAKMAGYPVGVLWRRRRRRGLRTE